MFETGKVYKHENCRDVAIRVSKILGKSDEVVSVFIQCINVVSRPYIIDSEIIRIKLSDVPKWKSLEI